MIDVSTVIRMMAEPRNLGVDTKFAILDAGYHANANADALRSADVSFLMPMKQNLRTDKEVVSEHRAAREGRANVVMHNGGLVYARRVSCVSVRKGARAGHTCAWMPR